MILLGIIGYQEILVIALLVLLFFGGSKIPELMRGLGKGVKAFKDGMSGLDDDDKNQQKIIKDQKNSVDEKNS